MAHETYLSRDRYTARWIRHVAFGVLLASMGLRYWLGAPTLHGPFDASLLAIWGVLTLLGGDRWGLTRSRHFALRLLGWIVVLPLATALLIAAYRVFSTR